MSTRVALTVLGNGRLDYLHKAVYSALIHLPSLDYYLMVDDSGDQQVADELTRTYPTFTLNSHLENFGMAFSVADGFQLALSTDADYVFWLEEDMVLTSDIPVARAITELESHPSVAQMLFQRQPLTPQEIASGTVLGAMGEVHTHGAWSSHRHIFSLNPCLIPRRILEYGWPAGPLGVGNETGMTNRLLQDGWSFGVWHGQHCEHIGHERAAVWQL